jgi:hypothetical protein
MKDLSRIAAIWRFIRLIFLEKNRRMSARSPEQK